MAILKYSSGTGLIFLKEDKMTICFNLMVDIDEIKRIKDIRDGFFTIETDCGEEYIDFIELVETNNEYSDIEKARLKKTINNIKLSNTKLEVA